MNFIQEIYFNVLNLFIVFALFFFNIYIVFNYIKKLKLIKEGQHNFIWLICLEHFVFSFLFYLVSYTDTSDAIMYYEHSKSANNWFDLFSTGTSFIKFIIYPFAKIGLSYFSIHMIFSTFGVLGFYKLYMLLLVELKNHSKSLDIVCLFFFLLPTFHFYTSGIGKDALVFYLLVIVFVYIKKYNKLHIKCFMPIVFIALIRPHIAAVIIISYLLVLFFSSQIKLKYKFGIVFLAAVLFFLGKPILEEKINIDLSSFASIEARLNSAQSYGLRTDNGSSSIDATNFGVVFKMFATAFLPLIWKADSVLKYIVSVENFYLVILLLLFLLKQGKIKFMKQLDVYIYVLIVYSFVIWFVFSQALYNLGLSTRQKYMFIPFLYFFIILFLSKKSKNVFKQ